MSGDLTRDSIAPARSEVVARLRHRGDVIRAVETDPTSATVRELRDARAKELDRLSRRP